MVKTSKLIRIWILTSWSFLTFGILLGSWWAYHELGWGGWWFWDPVENASLMPWLLATACIHSITNQKLSYWTIFNTIGIFILSILGTFFVRSGLLSSVHSFATDSTRGLYLLFFLLSVTFISLFQWASYIRPPPKRWPDQKNSKQNQSPPSAAFGVHPRGRPKRAVETDVLKKSIEKLLYLQNLFFFVICLVVFCGTCSPIFFHWFWNREVGTGAPFYNGTLIPLFTSILFALVYAHYIQFDISTTFAAFGKVWRPSKIWSLGRRHLARPKRALIDALRPKRAASLTALSKHYNLMHFYLSIFYCFHVVCLHFWFEFYYLDSIIGAVCFLFISSFFIPKERQADRFGRRDASASDAHTAPVVSNNKKNESTNKTLRDCLNLLLLLKRYRARRVDGLLLTRRSLRTLGAIQEIANALERRRIKMIQIVLIDMLARFKSAPSSQVFSQRFLLTKPNSDFPKKAEMKLAHAGIVLFVTGILLSNTFKIQFTQQLHSGSLVRLGSQVCCLRSIDHSFAPTYHSICANLLVFDGAPCATRFSSSIEPLFYFQADRFGRNDFSSTLSNSGRPSRERDFVLSDYSQCEKNQQAWRVSGVRSARSASRDAIAPLPARMPGLCMFPEKRFYYSNQELTTTKVAIHTNLFSDFYGLVGTGTFESGWFTTLMRLPFIFCIWLGFLFAGFAGIFSLKKQLQNAKLHWT